MQMLKVSFSTVLFSMAVQGCVPHHHHPHPPQLQKASFPVVSKSTSITKNSVMKGKAGAEEVMAAKHGGAVSAPFDPALIKGTNVGGKGNLTGSAVAATAGRRNTIQSENDDPAFSGKFWEKFILKGLELLVPRRTH